MTRNDWFRVDKGGLAQIYERRGPAAPFFELISNAWDEAGVTEVLLTVEAVPNSPMVEITITDDSTEGFLDLDDARTLFAPSYKKGEAEKRGRFNVGEKLFLSLCYEARICSTGGTLRFKHNGSVTRSALPKRKLGTVIDATMRMTREDGRTAFRELNRLIPPAGIFTRVEFKGFEDFTLANTIKTEATPAATFEARLQTELSDGEGVIRPTQRIGKVQVWAGEGWLYELGIPVVEIGGLFDINVLQKVPLNIERENVTPAFLRRLRAHTLNHCYASITRQRDANEAWVTEAMGSTNPAPTTEALDHVMELRFGKRRVAYDPSDPEGTKIAMSEGYTVVPGGALPKAAWTNVKASGTILPAGQVTPSKSDKAAPSTAVDPADIEGGVEVVAAYKRLAQTLIGGAVKVTILKADANVLADYGGRWIRLNLQRLGRDWFKRALDAEQLLPEHVELLIHELGHEFASDHLDARYYRSQTQLGVKLAFLVAADGTDLFDLKVKS